MSDKHPMTPLGQRKLQADLKRLTEVERPKVVHAIEVARAHGDLSENAEYHAAKEKQGMIEANVRLINTMLSHAEVIDPEKLSGERVVFGATVVLYDIDNDTETTYQIVGTYEADLKKNKISYESPIARSIIGKFVGDEVVVQTPKGPRNFEINDVSFE